jgi:hypothetical protein
MGVLDIFSGEDGRNTAIWGVGNTQAGANAQRQYLNTGAKQGVKAIDTGATKAAATLDAGAKLSLAALNKGAEQGRTDINTNYGLGADALTSGRDLSLAALNANPDIIRQAAATADSYYAPLGAEADRGFSVYGDAAGVNGAAGQDRATQNFRAGPGYQFQLAQGIDAATRAANAAGMTASGNTMTAAQTFGSGLADKEFSDYMTRLAPYLQLAPQIAGARAGIQTGMSDDLTANNTAISGLQTGYGKDTAALRMGQGNTLASLATGLGSNISNINTGLSTNKANVYSNAGTNRANIYTGLGTGLSNVTGAETQAVTGQGQAGLQAGQTANQNVWNAGLEAAKLGVGNVDKIKSAFS